MARCVLWFASVAFFGVCVSSVALAASPENGWPTFRGVKRTAVSPDTGLLSKWPEGGPKLLWESAGARAQLFEPGDR